MVKTIQIGVEEMNKGKRIWFECEVCGGGKIYTAASIVAHKRMWHE